MKKMIYSVLLVCLLPLSSCVHYYYAPNAHNVPLHKEKREVKAVLALSGGEEFSGFEGQFSTAVGENIGVMANFFSARGDNESESGSGTYFEVGAGYFKPLGKKFVFETYGGAGLGSVKNEYSLGESKVRFTRLFVQPNIGFSTKHFEIALSARLAGLNYHSIDYGSVESYDKGDLIYLKDNSTFFLIEPAITIRGGWEAVKVQLQLVHSQNNGNLPQEETNFSIGLLFNFPSNN